MYLLFGYHGPLYPKPYRTLIVPFKGTLKVTPFPYDPQGLGITPLCETFNSVTRGLDVHLRWLPSSSW